MGSLSPSLLRPSLLTRTLTLPRFLLHCRRHHHHHHHLLSTPAPSSPRRCIPMRRRPFSATPAIATATADSKRRSKKLRRDSPEGVLRQRLDMCSKNGDLPEALRLYDEARSLSIPLCLHHYNVLLYLCSSLDQKPLGSVGLERGFEIYRHMCLARVNPNEATFTSLARLAAAKEDPEMAFDLVKKMMRAGIDPKLRSYGPALFGFCGNVNPERAYEVERHMEECGIAAEEAEIAALLEVSSRVGNAEEVYRLMHKLRASVRQVTEATAGVVEGWFRSETAAGVGLKEWDVRKVEEGVVKGGGGWHGQGWLGKGTWDVGRSEMEGGGICKRCGEQLACIDIDPLETENFARSLSVLACQKEVKANFLQFQEWLSNHGPYDAVIDGANVGLYQKRVLSFSQLNSVLNGIRQMSPSKKMPLIILHNRRLKGGSADSPTSKMLIERWTKSGALYATPNGSNDDWYWLYAAVSCKSLLVTNDEMRDHLFQLLGNSFFPRWKEKHQVRLSVSTSGLAFHLPPPYSIVTQESETGNWHIPTILGDDIETPRQWVCASRFKVSNPRSLRKGVASRSNVKAITPPLTRAARRSSQC